MNLPENIQIAMDVLKSGGYESYVVGGCVRDAMMGIEPHDYDLTTSATPEHMLKVFEGFRIIETGIKHGTVTVVVNGENIEITTFRIDGAYTDNRHPETVEFTRQLSEDLSRRDFTVNAMAYSPECGLVDLFSGMDDLKHGIIRCVGDADLRFNEDGLRILRALRFASKLGFDIEKKTAESIHKNRGLLNNISKERIYSEFTKLLCGKKPAETAADYSDVISEFITCKGDLSRLSCGEANHYIRYAYFLKDCENPAKELKAIRADNDTIRTVSDLCGRFYESFDDVLKIRYLLRDKGEDFAMLLCGLYETDGRDTEFFRKTVAGQRGVCLSLKQLAVSGRDLADIGVNPGKNMGCILNASLDAVIKDEIPNCRDELLAFAKSMLDNLSCP